MRKLFDLQLFAEQNTTTAADIEPGISIDFVSKFTNNITELQKVLGITEMEPMAAGTNIEIYKTELIANPEQSAEGETIPLTKFKRVKDRDITITLKDKRRNTTAQAIQKHGRNMAVNQMDEKLVSLIQKEIKADFFNMLLTGTGTAEGVGLQATLANAWGELNVYHEDEGATPVHFLSPLDVAEYLANAQITMQTAFGLSYVEDFLGLGTVIVSPRVTKGKTISTAKENLHGAFIPANTGDVAKTFGLSADSTGLIGIGHFPVSGNATVDTLAMYGVVFYPERIDGVIVGTINPAAGA